MEHKAKGVREDHLFLFLEEERDMRVVLLGESEGYQRGSIGLIQALGRKSQRVDLPRVAVANGQAEVTASASALHSVGPSEPCPLSV